MLDRELEIDAEIVADALVRDGLVGLLEDLAGLFVLADVVEEHRQADRRVGVVRIERERAAELLDRLADLPLHVMDDAEKVEGVGVLGLAPQAVAHQRFGLGEVAADR